MKKPKSPITEIQKMNNQIQSAWDAMKGNYGYNNRLVAQKNIRTQHQSRRDLVSSLEKKN